MDIGIGTFALVPVHATVAEGTILPVERPVFKPCRLLRKFYQLKCAKTTIPGKNTGASPAQPLHLAQGCRHLCDMAEQRLFPCGKCCAWPYLLLSSTLSLPRETVSTLQLTLCSSWLLATGGKASLCLLLSNTSILEMGMKLQGKHALVERCPKAGH